MNRLLLLLTAAHFSASQPQNQPVSSVRWLEWAGAAGAGATLSEHRFHAALLLLLFSLPVCDASDWLADVQFPDFSLRFTHFH